MYVVAYKHVTQLMGLVLGPSLMIISIMCILLYAKVFPLYNVLLVCIVVVYIVAKFLTGNCTLGHENLHVYKISDLYLLCLLRYWDSN